MADNKLPPVIPIEAIQYMIGHPKSTVRIVKLATWLRDNHATFQPVFVHNAIHSKPPRCKPSPKVYDIGLTAYGLHGDIATGGWANTSGICIGIYYRTHKLVLSAQVLESMRRTNHPKYRHFDFSNGKMPSWDSNIYIVPDCTGVYYNCMKSRREIIAKYRRNAKPTQTHVGTTGEVLTLVTRAKELKKLIDNYTQEYKEVELQLHALV